jgi:hypothetical protein
MSYTHLSDSSPTSRKRHRCIWCGQFIEAGDRYERTASIYDGEFQSDAWHPECRAAMLDEMHASPGGDFEFFPHENERGILT